MERTFIPAATTKFPLFVTRFGLSDRTAIGVQTKLLLGHFPDYLHLYWNEGLLDRHFPKSRCLENWPFARISALKRKTSIASALQRLNVSRWRDETPSPSLRAYFETLRERVSTVYFAPIDSADARRMKEMASLLNLPFVIHLWDFLDNEDDEATHWLIRNSKHVFCLDQAILKTAKKAQNNSSILPFNRLPSKARAAFSSGRTTSIAIMGDIGSYIDGVRDLISAVDHLNNDGKAYTIVYIGNPRSLKRLGLDGCSVLSATGFIASPARRDEILSQCAIGFMPGPTKSPDHDSRSKYSIPSRILDFMAVGMPVVGTVHSDSATFSFCRELGIHTWLVQKNPVGIASALAAHAERGNWTVSSEDSLTAFKRFHTGYDLGELKNALKEQHNLPTVKADMN